jgi:putative CocE/NonD family hydrolase
MSLVFRANLGHDKLARVQEPWSDGQVGTFGPSYRAGTQNALAVERPPHLRAMFVVVGTSNYHEDGAARGGAAYLLHNVAYAFSLAATSKEAREDSAREAALRQASGELGAWLKAHPFAPNASPLSLVPAYQRWFQDFVDHADYDDYWKKKWSRHSTPSITTKIIPHL